MDAPQTVLKTAELTSASVHQRPPRFGYEHAHSEIVRPYPWTSAGLAVFLAVNEINALHCGPASVDAMVHVGR